MAVARDNENANVNVNDKGLLGRELTKRNSNNKETRTPAKTGNNFLRFGRSGSFMRFGRNNNEGLVHLLAKMNRAEGQQEVMERQQRASNGYLRFGRNYPSQGNVLLPAEAIWPLDQQRQQEKEERIPIYGQQEEFLDDPEAVAAVVIEED